MKFNPLNSWIQVMPFMPEQTSRGFILAPSAQEKPTQGEVIAVGPGKVRADGTLAPMPAIKPKDVVAWPAGSLQVVKTTEGAAFIVDADSLLGVEPHEDQ